MNLSVTIGQSVDDSVSVIKNWGGKKVDMGHPFETRSLTASAMDFTMDFVLRSRIRAAGLVVIYLSSGLAIAQARTSGTTVSPGLAALQVASPVDPLKQAASSSVSPDHSPTSSASETSSTPTVVYEHGLLTISAENVRLSEILAAIHSLMGAQIDVPAGSSDERIWARLGPGPARKVVSDLLSNTDLNYVIQGSLKDVNGIGSVMLTARSESGPSKVGVPNQTEESMANRHDSEVSPVTAPAPEQASAASQPPPSVPAVTPDAPAPTVAEANPVTPTPAPTLNPFSNPPPPSSLTTDQMVQQLTNMYQQRKLLQQNQTSSTPN